jgi:CMP-N-acetylneuraminic acid synthetase
MHAPDLLIVVPARGGSKGLPRKNARVLGDLPLLGWTAQAVAQSGLRGFTCILSTDDDEIAALGRDVGLDVPFLRPADIAGDSASAQVVALHALDWLQRTRNIAPDYVMWLQPTSPFRPPHAIARAYELMRATGVDAVVGVKEIHRSPDTLFHLSDGGLLTSLGNGATAATRRQEVKTLYTPNGAMYLVRARVLRELNTFFPQRSHGLPMNAIESLDIDDAVDWMLAEAVARGGAGWRSA